MLQDLGHVLNRQSERAEDDFKRAANALLVQQFLYFENERQTRHYQTVMRHFDYFKNLFDALGWQLYADRDFAYVGVLPSDEESYLQLGLDATLILFTARQLFEDGIENSQTQQGRVYVAVEDLLARFEALTRRERPSRPAMKELVSLFARHGLFAKTEDDESGNQVVALLPALRQIAGDRVLERIEAQVAASKASAANANTNTSEESASIETQIVNQ
jgi:hypothetical protein